MWKLSSGARYARLYHVKHWIPSTQMLKAQLEVTSLNFPHICDEINCFREAHVPPTLSIFPESSPLENASSHSFPQPVQPLMLICSCYPSPDLKIKSESWKDCMRRKVSYSTMSPTTKQETYFQGAKAHTLDLELDSFEQSNFLSFSDNESGGRERSSFLKSHLQITTSSQIASLHSSKSAVEENS